MKREKKTVLLIDDDLSILYALKMIIDTEGGQGYALAHSLSSDGSLERLSRGGIDLILLDIMMPGLSGMDLLDRITEMNERVPVVMLSAIDTAKAATEAFKKGAVDYITKPFTNADIIKVLDRYLH